MKTKIILLIFLLLSFNSCTKIIVNVHLKCLEYPNWINIAYPNYIGKDNKQKYKYNDNNFFIYNSQTFGANHTNFAAVINPKIKFTYLYIEEISFNDENGDKIYLLKNKKIKNKNRMFIQLCKIKFNNFDKYFKNRIQGENIKTTLIQKYKFDNGPLINENTPFQLSYFNDEYNPLNKFIID